MKKISVLALSSHSEVHLDLDILSERDERDVLFNHWVAHCRRCKLSPDKWSDLRFGSADEVAKHLAAHLEAGHKIGRKTTVASVREAVSGPLDAARVYPR